MKISHQVSCSYPRGTLTKPAQTLQYWTKTCITILPSKITPLHEFNYQAKLPNANSMALPNPLLMASRGARFTSDYGKEKSHRDVNCQDQRHHDCPKHIHGRNNRSQPKPKRPPLLPVLLRALIWFWHRILHRTRNSGSAARILQHSETWNDMCNHQCGAKSIAISDC